MAGKVRQLIDELLRARSRGNAGSEHFVKAKLLLCGIDPDAYSSVSADDPEKIAILERMLRELRTPR